MTRHWQTRDSVTNANLEYVESLAQLRPGLTVEQFMGKLRAVIGIRRMLPAAVLRHFDLPFLFIGDDAYDWDADRLEEEAARLCAALDTGLAAAHADPGLARGGAADLSDRPPTRGEEIAAALHAYRDDPCGARLSDLRHACSSPGPQRLIDRLDKWLARKRPSSPDRPIAYEIASVLGDIRRDAEDFHHEPASHRFTELRRAATIAERS